MSASPARRARRFARKRLYSSAVQSVSPKDPKPESSSRDESGSEAVKPAGLGVRMHVATAIELAQEMKLYRETFDKRVQLLRDRHNPSGSDER